MKVILLMFVFCGLLFAEKVTINLDIICDEVGNAKVVWKQKATAAQWQALMQIYGNNPALLKKEVIYSMPDTELTNFHFKKDEMNREFQFVFDAKGFVKYRGDGRWQFDYEKKYTPRKINDKIWFFSYSESSAPGMIEEYDITLKLPEKAKKIHLDRNEFNEPVLEYYLKPRMITTNFWIRWIGVLFLVIGIILVVAALFYKEKGGLTKNEK